MVGRPTASNAEPTTFAQDRAVGDAGTGDRERLEKAAGHDRGREVVGALGTYSNVGA